MIRSLKNRLKARATGSAFASLSLARLMAWVAALLALRHRASHWGRCYIAWNARITGWGGIELGRNVVISRESWLNVNERRSGVPSLRILDNTFVGQNNLFAVGRAMVFREYGITGVPALIVNGKYRSSAQQAGDFTTLLKLVDFLADKEHKR